MKVLIYDVKTFTIAFKITHPNVFIKKLLIKMFVILYTRFLLHYTLSKLKNIKQKFTMHKSNTISEQINQWENSFKHF